MAQGTMAQATMRDEREIREALGLLTEATNALFALGGEDVESAENIKRLGMAQAALEWVLGEQGEIGNIFLELLVGLEMVKLFTKKVTR